MEMVSILEFRRHAETIIRKVERGKRLILTYRGKPMIRLEPLLGRKISPDDSFYTLDRLAVARGGSLTNKKIDQIVYEK